MSVARLRELREDPEEWTRIESIILDEGLEAGGLCPCSDCDGLLETHEITWTDTSTPKWTIKSVPVLRCPKCQFQFRNKEERA